MLKIITNPPFLLCGRKKKALKDLFDIADDYVVLATWLFCNNILEQQELIMPEEWRDIYQTIGISVKHLPRNKEVKPKFYLEITSEYKEGFYVNTNNHYTDVNRQNCYKNLKLDDFTEDSLIRKVSTSAFGHYYAKGARKSVYVVPKKDYSKYEEQIFIDTLRWQTLMMRYPLIRKEFVDEDHNEPSL